MTISTTASSVTILGNGSTTVFNFSFVGGETNDIIVQYTNSSGGTSTLSPSVYTLTFNTVAVGELWAVGGTVTYPLTGPAIAVGTSITITRAVPFEQTVTISNQGAFYPQAVEQGLDLLEMQIQQLDNIEQFNIQTPLTDPSPPPVLPGYLSRADKYLYFDSSGNPTVTAGPPAPVSQLGIGTTLVFLSAYATLALADTAAVAVSGCLVIDADWTLTGNSTLNAKQVLMAGGVFTLGNYNLVFTGNVLMAGANQIFNYNGSGVVTGTIQAPGLPVEWWGAFNNATNATATRAAVQYACNYVIQSLTPNAEVWMFGQSYLFDATSVTVSAAQMPLIRGQAGTTNVSFSPVSDAAAFILHGTSPGDVYNGGVTGINILGNSHTIGVELRNVNVTTVDISMSGTYKLGVYLHNGASGEFTESNIITIDCSTLPSTAQMAKFVVDGGGSASFANNKFRDCMVSTLSGVRSLAIIESDLNSWWYGGELDITVNNNAGSAATNLISNQQSSGAPMWIVGGKIHLEATDSTPIIVVDSAHNAVLFGGTVMIQGTSHTAFSKCVFIQAYKNGSSTQHLGVNEYDLVQTFTGNVGVGLTPASQSSNYMKIRAIISNGDNSYNASIQFDVVQDISSSTTGTTGNTIVTLNVDTHSYGNPVPSMSTHIPTITNSNWIAETMTINYEVVASD